MSQEKDNNQSSIMEENAGQSQGQGQGQGPITNSPEQGQYGYTSSGNQPRDAHQVPPYNHQTTPQTVPPHAYSDGHPQNYPPGYYAATPPITPHQDRYMGGANPYHQQSQYAPTAYQDRYMGGTNPYHRPNEYAPAIHQDRYMGGGNPYPPQNTNQGYPTPNGAYPDQPPASYYRPEQQPPSYQVREPYMPPSAQQPPTHNLLDGGLSSFLNFKDERFLKGALVGAAVTFLLTNDSVQKNSIKSLVKIWSLLQGGVEEVKERFRDAEAEISAEEIDK